jgi:hypothetical protein
VRSRILPPEEWERLAGTEAETVWPVLDPENARVLVVEEDGEIVATWTAMRVVHMECIWVKPSHRGLVSVARRLFMGLREIASAWGARRVWTASLSPEVTGLIERFGGEPIPGAHFLLPLGIKTKESEEHVCPQLSLSR